MLSLIQRFDQKPKSARTPGTAVLKQWQRLRRLLSCHPALNRTVSPKTASRDQRERRWSGFSRKVYESSAHFCTDPGFANSLSGHRHNLEVFGVFPTYHEQLAFRESQDFDTFTDWPQRRSQQMPAKTQETVRLAKARWWTCSEGLCQ